MSKVSITKRVGDAVRALRREKKLSQKELAARSKLHVTFISGIEQGNRNVTIETAFRIAESLGVPLTDLFDFAPHDIHGERRPTPVMFVKLGGTWDMKLTNEGLKGSGKLDDEQFGELEKTIGYDERKLCETLEREFSSTKAVPESIGTHLQWVPGLDSIVMGDFIPLFSADSSHYRPAVLAPALSYLLRNATEDPSKQVIAGMGTDTVDIMLPYLDAFLFDKKHVPPILISGANRSYREPDSDAPKNFRDLAYATVLPLSPGAYYFFDGTIFKGGDILKVDPNEEPTSLEGQKTFFAPQRTHSRIGFLETGSLRREEGKRVPEEVITYSALEVYNSIKNTSVINLGDVTDLDEEVSKINDPTNAAIVIIAHALGNVPFPIRRAAISAAKEGKLITNVSRSLIGNVSDRYYVSLGSANKRELAGTDAQILDGGRLNSRVATALMVRALLEKKNQKETQQMINAYRARTF